MSSTKAFNRFRPPSVTAAVGALELAQEHHAAACNAAWTAFLADFSELYLPFRGATQALAALDAPALARLRRPQCWVRLQRVYVCCFRSMLIMRWQAFPPCRNVLRNLRMCWLLIACSACRTNVAHC